ncbi:GNAT family N-acetyltransferase [Breoghania sp.]|uniref:GNAT family N-acetyltransferase n=1 Tax=Breoghania sp. TaxID=2065378 RepID=UPI0029C9DD08|nr:GNAT family N-acetyltransferase [Breoghania sp.]
MSASITIRPLAPEDHADWRRLWNAYLEFYETEKPEEVYETTWTRLMNADVDPKGFIALNDEGQAVGIVHYLFHVSAWLVGPTCYIQDLYVDGNVRGGGVGRKLMETVYKAADEAGAESVYWMTQHFNETARKLYDRIGTLTPFIKYAR